MVWWKREGGMAVRILITNDDGVSAPGIQALAQELAGEWDWVMVAPVHERSGSGQAFTFAVPYSAKPVGDRVWHVEGTPVDCVMFAFGVLGPFDAVISGINRGANLAWDVFYSGTVGAAFEGARRGVPALAVSLDVAGHSDRFHYAEAARRVAEWMRAGIFRAIPPGMVGNLNIPNDAFLLTRPLTWGRWGNYAYHANEMTVVPGQEHQWRCRITEPPEPVRREPDTDGALIRFGPVLSLLPLQGFSALSEPPSATLDWLSATQGGSVASR